MDLEEQVMGIIVNAGQSRSLCYEALECAKLYKFDEADKKLTEAEGYAKQAHLIQTRLIEADEGEGKTPMTLIMVHAQDHIMTAMLAKEMITELIVLYKLNKLNKLRNQGHHDEDCDQAG